METLDLHGQTWSEALPAFIEAYNGALRRSGGGLEVVHGYGASGVGSGLGGAIHTSNSTVLHFNGTNNFINNSASGGFGSAIYTYENTVLYFNGTNNFINNSASDNGGAIFTKNSVLNFSGASNFINNSATFGGAIYTSSNSTLTLHETVYFTNNGHYEEVDSPDEYTYGGSVSLGLKSTF